MGVLRSHFRPEFLNRVDDVILFHSLRKEDLRQIVGIQLKRVEKLLSEQKIKLHLSDAALDHLVEAGYDPVYGARPIKRAIQRELENAIATKLLEQVFTEGDTIQVEWENDQLVFLKHQSSTPTIPKIEPNLITEESLESQIK